MTPATPKPRAGEHTVKDTIRCLSRMELESYALDALAERDLLRERERELVKALNGCVLALRPIEESEPSARNPATLALK